MNAPHSISGPVILGGILVLYSAEDINSVARHTNPMHLMVHGNPTLGIKCCAMSGYMTPPVTLPVVANPTATPLHFLKYVLITDSPAQNIIPLASPLHTPWARKNCQYSLHCAVMNMLSTCSAAPIVYTRRK